MSLMLLLSATLVFSPPSTAVSNRRHALLVGASVFGLSPNAVRAEYFGEPPPKAKGEEYKAATQKAKDFQVAVPKYAPGEGSQAFKAAEQRRNDVAAGKVLPQATVQDDLARLGLKAYGS